MRNVPRIFIDHKLASGQTVPLTEAQHHYLTRVMRTDKFLAFNNGDEFNAVIYQKTARILDKTGHKDPSGGWTFCFTPIKKIDDLVSGIVQMGVGTLQPVITERTVARYVNWDRVKKIIIENAEQSGRNSIPKLLPPSSFADLDKKNIVYGDERRMTPKDDLIKIKSSPTFLIGPEGGFSDAEFAMLDKSGAIGVSLGETILRAEVAAIALIAIAIKK